MQIGYKKGSFHGQVLGVNVMPKTLSRILTVRVGDIVPTLNESGNTEMSEVLGMFDGKVIAKLLDGTLFELTGVVLE